MDIHIKRMQSLIGNNIAILLLLMKDTPKKRLQRVSKVALHRPAPHGYTPHNKPHNVLMTALSNNTLYDLSGLTNRQFHDVLERAGPLISKPRIPTDKHRRCCLDPGNR